MICDNFVKLHSKLHTSPAMALGFSNKLWEIGDIVALVEGEESKADGSLGPYEKKVA
jgi:hypothetical protein